MGLILNILTKWDDQGNSPTVEHVETKLTEAELAMSEQFDVRHKMGPELIFMDGLIIDNLKPPINGYYIYMGL